MASVHDAETQEAVQSWGYMLRADNTPTDKLDRLLRGIAACISSTFGQTDNYDLSPVQLAAFYKSVGGDYDPLFLEMPHQSIAFIYKSLGCLHSLQPGSADLHAPPSIPSLKTKGFVTWQTIQLLLVPEAHVPFLQTALRIFDVRDPDGAGQPFPKLLPATCFPTRADPRMEAWHSQVSEHLRIDAERGASVRPRPTAARSSGEISVDGSADERADAAKYFSNPVNRNREGKPGIIKQITNAPVKIFEGGKMVANSVLNGGKMVADPRLFSSGRRRSLPDRTVSTESGASHGENNKAVATRSSRKSPRRHRSPSTNSSSDSSDVERIRPTRVRKPKTTHARTASQSGGYFPRTDRRREGSSSSRTPASRTRLSRSPARRPNADFNPSASPPWAATVGSRPPHQSPEYLSPEQRRPSMNQRASSEQRSVYDQGPSPSPSPSQGWNDSWRPRYADGYLSEARSERRPSQPQPPQPPPQAPAQSQGQPPAPAENNEWSDARRASARAPDATDTGYRDRRSSAYSKTGMPVNGVKGRKYPNETPWQS